MSHIHEKRYTTKIMLAAAEVDAPRFRSWRNQYGLFPETRVEGTKKRPWNVFSLLEVFIIRTVSHLVESGLRTTRAIKFAQEIAPEMFEAMFDDEKKYFPYTAIYGDALQFVAEKYVHIDYNITIDRLFDLQEQPENVIIVSYESIVNGCIDNLTRLGPEYDIRRHALKAALSGLVEGLTPDPEDSEND